MTFPSRGPDGWGKVEKIVLGMEKSIEIRNLKVMLSFVILLVNLTDRLTTVNQFLKKNNSI